VGRAAPKARVAALAERVQVMRAPASRGRIHLHWLLRRLGSQDVTSLLVEGGGEVNGSFLLQHLAHRIAFFYAPKIAGGRASRRAVAGEGAQNLAETLNLKELLWRRIGPDLMLTARVAGRD
jgi:diaminohydroxyphosphoribosylaminopyrimidine deaminase/5-amino-6-(5-phosphoribosylamino)uracil reductase